MRSLLVIVGCGLLASCSRPRDAERVEIDPPARAEVPVEVTAPGGPWGIRLLRRCSSWRYAPSLVDDRHVFGCPGAVHDRATGELLSIERRGEPLATLGDRTVWTIDDERVVIRDGELRPSAEIDLGDAVWAAGRGAGSEVVISLAGRAVALDVSTGTVRELGERCAAASAIAVRDGSPTCAIGEQATHEMRLVGGAGERRIDWLDEPRFEDGRLIGLGSEGVVVIDPDGSSRLHRVAGAEELLDVRDGRALIARRESVVIVALDGSAEPEVVLAERAHGGALGDDVVLVSDRGELLWLRRGATLATPPLAVRAPDGFVALDAIVDGDWPAWGHGGSRWERHRGDVAAFERDDEDGAFAHLVVGWIDRRELARFEGDDAAWARALMARYLEHGTDRTARVYRDATGARVMRGHTYIGGCERTHVDVRVRELEGVLELSTMHTGDREHVDEVLGAIPARARAIDDGFREGYEGDPSVGEIE